MTKSCAILQSSYIPWKGYFDLINSVDEFILYDCVQFTRRDWRNRNRIKTQRGAEWLSIPVESKGNYLARIDEIQTSNPNWYRTHWDAVRHNYSKSAYYRDFRDVIENAFLSINTSSLSEINRGFLELICNILGVTTRFSSASEYNIDGDKNLRLIHLCQQVNANTYYSGPSAKSYVDEGLFASHGINVVWFDYDNYPEYTQLFPPFVHEVSVLDLIFNEGLNASHYMKSFNPEKD